MEELMKQGRSISYEKIKGMSVLESRSGAMIGTVSDMIIDPSAGKMLGIAVILPDKETQSIGSSHVHIGDDAVMISDGNSAALDFTEDYARGIVAGTILGAKLVTEDGRLVGQISEIHIDKDTPEIFYHIAGSNLQRMFGGGFYISAKIPKAYSPDGKRLIVPTDIEEHHAKRSLEEFSIPESDKGPETVP
jgi:uncharacterized protein YrrD